MQLYHYAPLKNTVLTEGLLSVSRISTDLKAYAHRAGSEDRQEILNWLDNTFPGRSRAISVLTEPIKWQHFTKESEFIDSFYCSFSLLRISISSSLTLFISLSL